MKKKYTVPKLTTIGDMSNNTLGASGASFDNGTRQASANGRQNNGRQNNAGPTTLDSNNFNNNGFNNNGF